MGIVLELIKNESDDFKKINEKLKNLLIYWIGTNRVNDSTVEGFQKTLLDSMLRYRYPVLNQLNVLKILLDSAILQTSAKMHKDIVAWLIEFHNLYESFDAPLHFTPNKIGFTYSALYLRCMKKKNKNNERKIIEEIPFDIKFEALRYVRESKGMYTMGRSFYNAITNLYYLYDDFNDQQIHRNHAMQMASSELANLYDNALMDGEKTN